MRVPADSELSGKRRAPLSQRGAAQLSQKSVPGGATAAAATPADRVQATMLRSGSKSSKDEWTTSTLPSPAHIFSRKHIYSSSSLTLKLLISKFPTSVNNSVLEFVRE